LDIYTTGRKRERPQGLISLPSV